MKIQQEKTEVVRSHDFKTIQYSVNTDNLPLLFQMLRTNLYSDIHGSIIRELMSNVVDAHTEANKPDAIGELEWIAGNKMLGVDCQLIIRDFGIGLSPDRMTKVYGNYLSSTKRGDNKGIGGFGLGSKSPFAYTDSFFVQTCYEGVKTKYLCYIDETQLGAISEMSIEECDCPNQTEIIIPIKNENHDAAIFRNAINKQLSYFRNVKYIGIEGPDSTILYEDQNCIVLEQPPFNECHIVVGCVAYQIDFGVLGIQLQWNDQTGLKNCGVGLKFDIGELQPTLSREKLFWDDKVKNKVLEKLKNARLSIRRQLEAELKAEKDYCKWFANINSRVSSSFPRQWDFSQIKTDAEFDSDGKKLPIQYKIDDWFSGHNIRGVTRYGRKRGASNPDYSTSFPSYEMLRTLPAYSLDKSLNSRTCLWLFKQHPNGFLVVNQMKTPDKGETILTSEPAILPDNFEATKLWLKSLPKYDDIVVPAGEFDSVSERDLNAYKAIVKQRKLEGKYTAKRMVKTMRSGWWQANNNLEHRFEYCMYEGKFELDDKKTIIYGFQEDHASILRITGMLLMSRSQTNLHENKDLMILKIAKNYDKQFTQLPNAYYIGDVLKLKTPINATFAAITTAHNLKELIHTYHMLAYFDGISNGISFVYKELHRFIEDYTCWSTTDGALKDLLNLSKNNLCIKMEDAFKSIKHYFEGIDLLRTVNFCVTSNQYHAGLSTTMHDSMEATYLKRYVELNKDSIKSYLVANSKHIDEVPKTTSVAVEEIEVELPEEVEI